jgi:hypothetical protein
MQLANSLYIGSFMCNPVFARLRSVLGSLAQGIASVPHRICPYDYCAGDTDNLRCAKAKKQRAMHRVARFPAAANM